MKSESRPVLAFSLLSLFLLCASTPADANPVTLTGNWTQNGDRYTSPPVTDLEAFREYFRAVLKGYDRYRADADQLADAIVAVAPIQLTLDASGHFGELGDTVQFNPLATGGTTDIATGGDFIDKQLDQPKDQFEISAVGTVREIYKEEFGPVQASPLRMAPPGTPGVGDDGWYAFRFLPQGPAMPGPSPEVFANNPTAMRSVVPEPATAALALLVLPTLCVRRRS